MTACAVPWLRGEEEEEEEEGREARRSRSSRQSTEDRAEEAVEIGDGCSRWWPEARTSIGIGVMLISLLLLILLQVTRLVRFVVSGSVAVVMT